MNNVSSAHKCLASLEEAFISMLYKNSAGFWRLILYLWQWHLSSILIDSNHRNSLHYCKKLKSLWWYAVNYNCINFLLSRSKNNLWNRHYFIFLKVNNNKNLPKELFVYSQFYSIHLPVVILFFIYIYKNYRWYVNMSYCNFSIIGHWNVRPLIAWIEYVIISNFSTYFLFYRKYLCTVWFIYNLEFLRAVIHQD